MNSYLALVRRERVGDEFSDAILQEQEAVEDAAFEDALAEQDALAEEILPEEVVPLDEGEAYGPPEAGYVDPYAPAEGYAESSYASEESGFPAGPSAELVPSGGGGGGSSPLMPSSDSGTPPPLPPPVPAPAETPPAIQDSPDERIALLEQDVDDAEQAYYDAYQADLDALDLYYMAQEALADGTGSEIDLRAAGEAVKPLAAALVPAYDALKAAKSALAAAASGRTVTGASSSSAKLKRGGSAVQKAKDLHRRTSAVHRQTAALQTLIKAAGFKPMTPATRSKARNLTLDRRRLAQERRAVKQVLRAASAAAKPQAVQPKKDELAQAAARPALPVVRTEPAARTSPSSPRPGTIIRPRAPMRAPAKPSQPDTGVAVRSRIHGEDHMNGYTILGETVGQGFDILSLFSGFLSGAKKEFGPSAAQMQLQEEARRAREAAARAQTTAWVVGGLAGVGALGLVLWKALAR